MDGIEVSNRLYRHIFKRTFAYVTISGKWLKIVTITSETKLKKKCIIHYHASVFASNCHLQNSTYERTHRNGLIPWFILEYRNMVVDVALFGSKTWKINGHRIRPSEKKNSLFLILFVKWINFQCFVWQKGNYYNKMFLHPNLSCSSTL